MTQNLSKNIIGNVASSYQVNLAIEIPNTLITENYILHIFTCRHIWYLQCLFKYTSRCWEVFLIGQIFFYSGGLRAYRNVSGKLCIKLAIMIQWIKIDRKKLKMDSKGIAPLEQNGQLYTSTTDKANILNQQFQSVFTPKTL